MWNDLLETSPNRSPRNGDTIPTEIAFGKRTYSAALCGFQLITSRARSCSRSQPLRRAAQVHVLLGAWCRLTLSLASDRNQSFPAFGSSCCLRQSSPSCEIFPEMEVSRCVCQTNAEWKARDVFVLRLNVEHSSGRMRSRGGKQTDEKRKSLGNGERR